MGIVICSRDWQEFLDQQKRQSTALERIATAIEKLLDDTAKIASLTQALREHTETLAAAMPNP